MWSSLSEKRHSSRNMPERYSNPTIFRKFQWKKYSGSDTNNKYHLRTLYNYILGAIVTSHTMFVNDGWCIVTEIRYPSEVLMVGLTLYTLI